MDRQVEWNNRAVNNFNKIIAYLEPDWNEIVVRNFITRTYQLIESLSQNPEIGTLENPELRVRAIILTKHNILFYRYTAERLIILNIFDTRQNPKKKRY